MMAAIGALIQVIAVFVKVWAEKNEKRQDMLDEFIKFVNKFDTDKSAKNRQSYLEQLKKIEEAKRKGS